MLVYHNNILCVEGAWLYDGASIMSEANYRQQIHRGKIDLMQRGGNGRASLVKYESLPQRFKRKIKEIVGDPYKVCKPTALSDFLEHDIVAERYYFDYTLENETQLPEKNRKEYTASASVLNGVSKLLKSRSGRIQALGGSSSKTWHRLAEIIQELPYHTWPHNLPKNHRRLKAKYLQYVDEGYEALIHGGFCNKNSEKIDDDAKLFVVTRWADRIRKVATIDQLWHEYNAQAELEGWKKLKSGKAIYNYLNQEDVKAMWWAYRYGELKAKEKYSYKRTTKLPSMRDALWYSDGTKLNLYYQENGEMKTCQVYEVMDAYSEVFLGFHISQTENYEAQYYAYKMAVQIAGHRPYQIAYDNQGGHKKLQSGNFLNKLARLSINTQPYNGSSKTIESAFGRFQNQFLKQEWMFTGMNITTKKNESKANMEFILDNKEHLPTLDELKAIYIKRREEWNSALHPKTGKSRIDMYLESTNDKAPEMSLPEIVDLFWIERNKPVKLANHGISFREKNVQHRYMTYTTIDGVKVPDVKWLRQNIDKPFIIKFDPDDMSEVWLYEKVPLGLRFHGKAEIVLENHRAIQEQESWEAQWNAAVDKQNAKARLEARDEMNKKLKSVGATAEDYGMNEPTLRGLESKKRKKRKKKADTDIGQHLKEESNQDLIETTNYWDRL